MKSINVLALLLSVLVILTGCTNSKVSTAVNASETKQLIYGTDVEIRQINPVLTDAQEIDSLLFRGLTKPSGTNEIVPDLAKDWEISSDHLMYTFTLREDAKWQDGAPVTAEDVKFTLETILDPATITPIAGEFSEVKEVDVLSPYKVRISLHKPYPSLLGKLKIGILPKHLLENEDINKNEFNQNPIGNGPFKIKKWESDHTITLSRNELYYGAKPKIDEIVFKPVLDSNARVLQLKTGEIDIALLEPNQLKSINEKDILNVYSLSTADYRAVMYNMEKPLFQDPKVRQAMSYMIDREAIVEGLLANYGEPAYGPLQKSWANATEANRNAFNPQQAEKLLKEAGWEKSADGILMKDGKRFEFELVSIATDPVRVSLANIVAEQLKPLGILVTPKPSNWDAIKLDELDALVVGWGSELDPDDHTYQIFHSSQIGDGLYNMGAYRNPKVDELLVEARTNDDLNARGKYYAEFQEKLAEDPPFNFLVYLDAIYVTNENVSGIGNRTLGHHGFGIVWNIEEWDIR